MTPVSETSIFLIPDENWPNKITVCPGISEFTKRLSLLEFIFIKYNFPS